MEKAGVVIKERNIRWVYGSHNAIVPGTELFFESAAFLEDVLSEKYDYTSADGIRVYEKDAIVAVYPPQE